VEGGESVSWVFLYCVALRSGVKMTSTRFGRSANRGGRKGGGKCLFDKSFISGTYEVECGIGMLVPFSFSFEAEKFLGFSLPFCRMKLRECLVHLLS